LEEHIQRRHVVIQQTKPEQVVIKKAPEKIVLKETATSPYISKSGNKFYGFA